MRTIQFFAVCVTLGVALSQQPPGLYIPPRSPGLGRQMTDFALNKFLSAVRGGGRGHRELLALTSNQYPGMRIPAPPGLSFGVPNGVTHVNAPPKVGAFYIAPPERNAPFFYGGGQGDRRPQMVRLADLKFAQPQFAQLITAETTNNPGAPQQLQFVQVPAASSSEEQTAAAVNPQQQASGENQGSLQEIIAKAARQQHNQVLQKEQNAHPNAQINSQILVGPHQGGPGLGAILGPQQSGRIPGRLNPLVGRQPIFINQFGQPFLAPAIIGPQGPQGPPPPNAPQFQGPPPPQFQYVQQGGQPPQQFLRLNSIGSGEIPTQLQEQQQQGQLQAIPQDIQHQQALGGQIQMIPLSLLQNGHHPGLPQAQDIQGGQLLRVPGLQGQFAIVPQQAIAGFQGTQGGQIIPGNSILGQTHIAYVGGGDLQGRIQNQQVVNIVRSQEQQQPQKEEQPSRPHEAASEIVPVTASVEEGNNVSNNAGPQVTAAIMQSSAEYSEPIAKKMDVEAEEAEPEQKQESQE